MVDLSEQARARILAQQEIDWPKQLAGASKGNPFATLCDHCCGRHRPPYGELCPHESIADLKARLHSKGTEDNG